MLFCILLLSITGGLISHAEDRPKVGLVLSGGGAKGIAHIGVIKALEDNDIPFDCVTGTSAGAIVGSLYACGWTPEEILGLFTSNSFKYWSTGTISAQNVYYETFPQPLPAWADVGINIGNDIKGEGVFPQILPSNLISPIPMNLEFLELYSPYTAQCQEDFNKLFIPLRTVCSDVYHKHKVVCSSGSLGDAVRASMSFPLVFKPIELDGVLMYDGGIYDNFPVDVMHEEFDPEFIIGVSVSGPDGKPEPGNIYSQLEDMIIQNNNYDLPESWGIKIQVPVLKFGVLDWEDAETIYNIGYKTGLSMVDSIKERCPYRRSVAELSDLRKDFKEKTPDIEFSKVVVEGATPSQAAYISQLFTEGSPKPIGMNKVKAGYYLAVTDGKLIDLLPQASFTDSWTRPDLILKATVKQPWNVGVGGWITSSIQSQLFLTFGYHTLSLSSLNVDLSGWVGQSYYAAELSGRISLPTNKPSSISVKGVISRQKYYEDELMFYQNRTPSFVNEAQQFLRFEYSRAISKPSKVYGKLSFGHVADEYFPYHEQNETNRDKTDYTGFVLESGYEACTLTNWIYPMNGRFLNANLMLEYDKSKFTSRNPGEIIGNPVKSKYRLSVSAKGEWKQFFPLHDNFILGAAGEGMVTIEKLYQNYIATLIHLPAFAPTPSTRNYFNPMFRSGNYVACGVLPIWSPLQKFQLRGDFYFYMPVRDIEATQNGCEYSGWFRRTEFIGEVAAVYNFKFASLSLYCNYLSYPARNWNFGINLGLLFQAPRFVR